jgi:hypothetical protein
VNFICLHHATFRGHHATFRQHHARIMLAPCHIMPRPGARITCSHHARTVPHHATSCHVRARITCSHRAHTSALRTWCLHTCGGPRFWRGRPPCRLAVSEAAGLASRASYRLPVPPPDSNGAVVALHRAKRASQWRAGPSPAAHGTGKVGVAVSRGCGEAVFAFPCDMQHTYAIVWRRP